MPTPFDIPHFAQRAKDAHESLIDVYTHYTQHISNDEWAISLEAAIFLQLLLEDRQPRTILDLGSGFSSYIFRTYAKAHPNCVVWTVDDNQRWLAKTQAFLSASDLSTEHLLWWSDFVQAPPTTFDFIFHDLGGMRTRAQVLPQVLRLSAPQGIVVLDDLHKKPYAQRVDAILAATPHKRHDARIYTEDKYTRFCIALTDVQSHPILGEV